MNNRFLQQARALEKLRTVEPIVARLQEEQDPRLGTVVFIHPDEWDELKQKYGDKLKEFL